VRAYKKWPVVGSSDCLSQDVALAMSRAARICRLAIFVVIRSCCRRLNEIMSLDVTGWTSARSGKGEVLFCIYNKLMYNVGRLSVCGRWTKLKAGKEKAPDNFTFAGAELQGLAMLRRLWPTFLLWSSIVLPIIATNHIWRTAMAYLSSLVRHQSNSQMLPGISHESDCARSVDRACLTIGYSQAGGTAWLLTAKKKARYW
jgi:hypothetical protein